MSERLTEDDLTDLVVISSHTKRGHYLALGAVDELRSRRAADAKLGHMQRIGAIADALPIDEEMDKRVAAALKRAREGHTSRKLTMPALTAEEREALERLADRLRCAMFGTLCTDVLCGEDQRGVAVIDKLLEREP